MMVAFLWVCGFYIDIIKSSSHHHTFTMRASFSSSGLLSIGLWLRWYWHACRRLLLKKPLAAANERKKHDRANVNSTHPTQKRERWISNTFHFSIYMVWIWKKVSKLWIFWVRSIHVEGFQSSNPQSSSSLSWSLSSSSSLWRPPALVSYNLSPRPHFLIGCWLFTIQVLVTTTITLP